jgi:hypothetical protein
MRFSLLFLAILICFSLTSKAGVITYDYINTDNITVDIQNKTDNVTGVGMYLYEGDPTLHDSSRLKLWHQDRQEKYSEVSINAARDLMIFEGKKYWYDTNIHSIGFYISTDDNIYHSYQHEGFTQEIHEASASTLLWFNYNGIELFVVAENLQYDYNIKDSQNDVISVSEPNFLFILLLALMSFILIKRQAI